MGWMDASIFFVAILVETLQKALYQAWFAPGARSEMCLWVRSLRLAGPGSGAGGPAYEILQGERMLSVGCVGLGE
jgi:hypothetical protein